MKYLVFGSDGWLGARFVRYLKDQGEGVFYAGRQADIANKGIVHECLAKIQPDVVVNCAGRTHSANTPNIDGCIESMDERLKTLAANAVGPGVLANACRLHGARFVHIGSGCIFNDTSGIFRFGEDVTPKPVSWYGHTKALGDQLALAADASALILRVRMPISAEPHPRNLITKLSGAKRVIAAVNSVTVVEPFLEYAHDLIKAGVTGIVHAVHSEPVYFWHLMQWYKEIVDPSFTCEFIQPSEYVTPDGRSNCVLTSRWFIPDKVEDACKNALIEYAQRKVAA